MKTILIAGLLAFNPHWSVHKGLQVEADQSGYIIFFNKKKQPITCYVVSSGTGFFLSLDNNEILEEAIDAKRYVIRQNGDMCR